MKYIIRVALLVIFFSHLSLTQNIRLMGLGGISYSVFDNDFQLTPFDLGRNPAYIFQQETHTYLKITPGYKSESGDYKRQYDPQAINLGGINFHGIKTLGDKGTFLGEMGYVYEYRDQVKRAITRDPYAGDAFFMIDTTVGNITYNGPKMMAMYSWMLTDNLGAGFKVMYGILSGLKSVYTYTKTIFRDADIAAGLTYNFGDHTTLGVRYEFDDKQEAIEANDVNLLDVEIYSFVGDTYSLRNRSSTISQKIRRKTHEVSVQLFTKAVPDLVIGVNAGIFPQKSEFMIPYKSIQEMVYGFSQKTDIYTDMIARYNLTDYTVTGFKFSYLNSNSWSKNARSELLVWEWNHDAVTFGIGGSHKLDVLPVLFAAEAEMSLTKIDSSKYIDRRFITDEGKDLSFRLGLEYSLSENLVFRSGYRYSRKDIDLTFGFKDVLVNQVSGGIDYTFVNGTEFQIIGRYSSYFPDGSDNKRTFIEALCQLKLNYF